MTGCIFRGFELLSSLFGWQVVVDQNLPYSGKSYCLHFCKTLSFLAITFDPQVLDSQSKALMFAILA